MTYSFLCHVSRNAGRSAIEGVLGDRPISSAAQTQAEISTAVEATLPTTKGRLAQYSRELYDAVERQLRSGGAVAELVAAD